MLVRAAGPGLGKDPPGWRPEPGQSERTGREPRVVCGHKAFSKTDPCAGLSITCLRAAQPGLCLLRASPRPLTLVPAGGWGWRGWRGEGAWALTVGATGYESWVRPAWLCPSQSPRRSLWKQESWVLESPRLLASPRGGEWRAPSFRVPPLAGPGVPVPPSALVLGPRPLRPPSLSRRRRCCPGRTRPAPTPAGARPWPELCGDSPGDRRLSLHRAGRGAQRGQ